MGEAFIEPGTAIDGKGAATRCADGVDEFDGGRLHQ